MSYWNRSSAVSIIIYCFNIYKILIIASPLNALTPIVFCFKLIPSAIWPILHYYNKKGNWKLITCLNTAKGPGVHTSIGLSAILITSIVFILYIRWFLYFRYSVSFETIDNLSFYNKLTIDLLPDNMHRFFCPEFCWLSAILLFQQTTRN